jgi:hypothetical protein
MLLNLIGYFRVSGRTDGGIGDPHIAIAIGGGVIIVAGILTCLSADEIQRTSPPSRTNAFVESFRALKDMSRAIRRVGFVYFCIMFSMRAFQSVLTDFFGRDVFHGDPAVDEPYWTGVAFGKLVVAIAYSVVLVYLPFNSKFVRATGFANTIAIAATITALSYSAGFWSTDKAVLTAFFSLAGIQEGVSFCLPASMVALIAPPEHFGKYEGALAFFGVAGAELSDIVFQYGIGSAFKKRGVVLGSAGCATVLTIIASRFLIEPEMD